MEEVAIMHAVCRADARSGSTLRAVPSLRSRRYPLAPRDMASPLEPKPSAAIDVETVIRIAALARLDIDADEARVLGRQFASILAQFEVLTGLDVEGVEPMTGASGAINVLREDVPVPSLPAEALLSRAPAREGDFYRVPLIVGGETQDEKGAGGRAR
jgi:aspartyl-tRNA(Asn)/glutamyl-tRNA(Gln) amidotransferase subunit C